METIFVVRPAREAVNGLGGGVAAPPVPCGASVGRPGRPTLANPPLPHQRRRPPSPWVRAGTRARKASNPPMVVTITLRQRRSSAAYRNEWRAAAHTDGWRVGSGELDRRRLASLTV